MESWKRVWKKKDRPYGTQSRKVRRVLSPESSLVGKRLSVGRDGRWRPSGCETVNWNEGEEVSFIVVKCKYINE